MRRERRNAVERRPRRGTSLSAPAFGFGAAFFFAVSRVFVGSHRRSRGVAGRRSAPSPSPLIAGGGRCSSPGGISLRRRRVDRALGEALDATTRSSSSTLMIFTPCALRPVSRISATLRAERLALVGDEHDLVARRLTSVMSTTGPLRSLASIRMMPLPPRFCCAELVERRALAVALLADREHVLARLLGDGHADDLVVVVDVDGLHAHRARGPSSAPGPRGSGSTARSCVAMRISRVPSVSAAREQLVVVLDLDADDALLAEVLVLGRPRSS